MSSDAEMVTPPASKRKGGRSTPPKQNGKKSKKEATPEVQEDSGEEEEYEIEEIIDCNKGMFAPNRWAFLVSWKGYGDDDNSWVDEPDLYVLSTRLVRNSKVLTVLLRIASVPQITHSFAKDMIEKWWLDNPHIKGNPLSGKKKGRKSEGASSKVKSQRESSVEAEDAKSSTKRKSTATSNAKKRASEEAEATPDAISEDDAPPKKKSRTSTAATKKKQESPTPQNGLLDEAEEGSGLDAHVLDAMTKHMGKKNWEKLIKSIETVERQEDGVLLVYYTSTDHIRAISESRILAEKAPQKLIEFYESHLRWRGAPQ
ncbi:hypothetical protein FRB90_009776 [Tulasnella sp. 427]|nr:hypothetical protein FRB90_009776 [Tulasnella sp. 427]